MLNWTEFSFTIAFTYKKTEKCLITRQTPLNMSESEQTQGNTDDYQTENTDSILDHRSPEQESKGKRGSKSTPKKTTPEKRRVSGVDQDQFSGNADDDGFGNSPDPSTSGVNKNSNASTDQATSNKSKSSDS